MSPSSTVGALVHVGEGVRVFSRPGRELTAALPVLGGLAEAVPGTVLDGELVADSGRAPTFYRLAGVLATPTRQAVTFVAFDVLAVGGLSLTAMPYASRRALLVGLELAGPSWCTIPSWTGVSADEVLAACEALDVEGVVAKRSDAPYAPGRRSPAWVKLKTESWRRLHGPRRVVDNGSGRLQASVTGAA